MAVSWVWFGISVACAALIGCSSDSATSSSSTSAGAGAGAGGQGAGGQNEGGTIVIDKGPTGAILADADSNDGGEQTLINASFQRSYANGCVTQVLDRCKFVDCSNAKTVTPISAGTLTVTGANSDISIEPTMGFYDYEPLSLDWGSGKQLTFKFAGTSDVPAFQIGAMSPPSPLITKPPFTDLMTLTIVRAAGFDVAWQGLQDELFQVVFVGGGAHIQLTCTWDGALGKASIPSSTMEMLDASQNDWTITTRATYQGTAKAGDFNVVLDVSARGQTKDGTGADGEVILL